MIRRRWLVLTCGLVVLALVGAGYRLIEERAFRAELEKARTDFESGYRGLARQRLAKLAEQWPASAEVLFQLGVCEETLGHREAALASWAKVPAATSFSGRAAALSGEVLIDAGRYREAETLLETARSANGPNDPDLRRALIRLYRFEGRTNDVRRLVRESWATAPDPVAILKELWVIDNTPVPAEALEAALAKADPNDDRVWLGQGNLAMLTGRFDEARRKLDACRKHAPHDEVIWRGLLDLGRASGDLDTVLEAASRLHLSTSRLTETEVLGLRAWLASRLGRSNEERKALLALLERDPGDANALERLATLAWDEGQSAEVSRFRAQKQAIDDAKVLYRSQILNQKDLTANIPELVRLAKIMGHRFDEFAWSHIHAGTPEKERGTAEALSQEIIASTTSESTLADRFADLHPPSEPAGSRSEALAVADPVFTDDAQAVGLQFTMDNGQTSLHNLPETMSGGVGVLDYDSDGWLDVYAVQGGSLLTEPSEGRDGDRLFRNQGDGTFRDVTAAAGLVMPNHDYGMGVTVGDYDNDGDPDLFVTRLQSYALYRNRGNGTFEDVTEAAGLLGSRDYPSSAAFADLDNDGDLDLYVCHYMVYDPEHPPLCRNEKGEYYYCDPSRVDPAPDHVFRNDKGKFVDVTAEAGFVDPGGRGLGVVIADVDDDNKVDLFVANDGTANYLFHNLGGFKFEEVGHISGVAGNAGGGYQAGMGVACVDLDGDGRPELLVTNLYGEGTTLYQNLGQGAFHDGSAAAGLLAATRYLLGFGIAPIDYDADGRPDLIMANGHVNDQRPRYPYAMPAKLFATGERGRLTDVSSRAGEPFQVLRVGRGLATADLDNDGKVDALIVGQNEPLAYFHNKSPSGRFVTFQLQGTRSNRDGVGAQVTLTSQGRRQVAQRVGGGSYLSACDPRLHFGLGTADRIESVEVRWPSGQIDRYANLTPDTGYLLREADPAPAPLPGFRKRLNK